MDTAEIIELVKKHKWKLAAIPFLIYISSKAMHYKSSEESEPEPEPEMPKAAEPESKQEMPKAAKPNLALIKSTLKKFSEDIDKKSIFDNRIKPIIDRQTENAKTYGEMEDGVLVIRFKEKKNLGDVEIKASAVRGYRYILDTFVKFKNDFLDQNRYIIDTLKKIPPINLRVENEFVYLTGVPEFDERLGRIMRFVKNPEYKLPGHHDGSVMWGDMVISFFSEGGRRKTRDISNLYLCEYGETKLIIKKIPDNADYFVNSAEYMIYDVMNYRNTYMRFYGGFRTSGSQYMVFEFMKEVQSKRFDLACFDYLHWNCIFLAAGLFHNDVHYGNMITTENDRSVLVDAEFATKTDNAMSEKHEKEQRYFFLKNIIELFNVTTSLYYTYLESKPLAVKLEDKQKFQDLYDKKIWSTDEAKCILSGVEYPYDLWMDGLVAWGKQYSPNADLVFEQIRTGHNKAIEGFKKGKLDLFEIVLETMYEINKIYDADTTHDPVMYLGGFSYYWIVAILVILLIMLIFLQVPVIPNTRIRAQNK